MKSQSCRARQWGDGSSVSFGAHLGQPLGSPNQVSPARLGSPCATWIKIQEMPASQDVMGWSVRYFSHYVPLAKTTIAWDFWSPDTFTASECEKYKWKWGHLTRRSSDYVKWTGQVEHRTEILGVRRIRICKS